MLLLAKKIDIKKEDLKLRGHSIEVRVNAEDPNNFMPSPGKVEEYFTPSGPGVRVDSCLYSGCTVPPYYDPMVAKLIVHGKDRPEAIKRLQRALEEFMIGGIKTTIPLHQRIAITRAFGAGEYDIHSLERFIDGGQL